MTDRPEQGTLKVRHDVELNSRARIHLEWMFENQPQLVRDLHNSNKLEDHLDRKYQQALELTHKFKEKGQSEEEAFQNASDLMEILISPRDRAKDGRVSAGIPRHPRPGNPGRDF
jgi:hypothetical protein